MRSEEQTTDALKTIPALVERAMPSVVTVDFTTNAGRGNGSGFTIVGNDETSVIVTNAHVVLTARRIVVVFSDHRCLDAKVICVEPWMDLAILTVPDAPLGVLEPRRLAEVRIGEPVIAIGAPYALSESVSLGIVSAVNRPRPTPAGGLIDMIQTDAAINSGNSGGPLIGLDGRVIGINSQGEVGVEGGLLEGIKFAVPIDTAIDAYNEVRETGATRLRRGALGIQSRPHWFDYGLRTSLRRASGAMIVGPPMDGGPAALAGLREGDVILTFDGDMVDDPGDLFRLLTRSRVGRECELSYIRANERRTTTVIPTPSNPTMEH